MNFKEAVASGKVVRSEFWATNESIDTTIFEGNTPDWMKPILCQTAKPLTWKELLGKWLIVE